MSIKLLDTIYKLTDNADKVDGKHASDFATSGHTHSYLPLSGGTLSGSGSGLLTINRTSGNPLIQFTANGTLVGFLGINTSGAPIFVNKDTTSYNLLHSNNSSVSKSGETLTVKINGTTQSLTNTNTTYSAGTGLSLSGTTFNHASSVTAGTAGTSSATSGSTLAVPYVTVNASGHVTGYGTHTHTISGFAASSHNHDRVKSIQPTGTTVGWYRVGTICSTNAGYSQNVIISLQRSYNSPENEHYIFAISVGYNGHISITQLCGYKGGQLIDKVRVVYNNSGNCYFDYYMKTSNYNNSYKVTILAGDFKTLQDIALVTDAGGTVFEFTTTNGCKSNYGFTGDLSGNASSASKLGTNAGSATNPVYFSGGVPVACTYSLNKTVPSNAVFTDTTYSTATSSTLGLVKIGYTASGKNYPVQLSSGRMYVNVPWTDTNTDTKNTAGSTNSSSKLFLIGATSQAANPQTYSHDTAYVGTDGCLYSNSTKVSVEGHTHSYASSSHSHNFNQITDAPNVYLNAGTVTRRVLIQNTKNSQGYISRATIGLTNAANQFSPVFIGVGTNDGGTTFTDYYFAVGGSISDSKGNTYLSTANWSSYCAAKSHTHSYAASSHNHDSVYSKLGHTHSYAASSHTHNYAGSSSAGGAATSANKLNTNAGSATKPVYFSGGVPVQVTGCMVQYWAIYEVYFSPSGTSGSIITKKAGNHNFCSSISSREALGQIIVNTSYPSGFDESTTMIFGVGDHAENNHIDSVYITINKQYGGGTQMRLILADDDRQNWGYAHLYFLCIG